MKRFWALWEHVVVGGGPEPVGAVVGVSGAASAPSWASALAAGTGDRSFFRSLGFVISLGGSMSSDVMMVVAVLGAWALFSPGMPPETRKSSRRS